MADSKHRGLWMVAIIALLGALAFVALRSPAPQAPAAAAPLASGPLSPAVVTLDRGPLGPFDGPSVSSGLLPAAPTDWSMEGLNPGRTRAAASPLSLPLTRQRAVPMPADRETGSPPVIARGLMLVETKDQLRAFDLRSGSERWVFDNRGSYISPAVSGDRAYIRAESNNTGQLIALDLQSGATAWQFTPKRISSDATDYFGGHIGSPVVVDGTVFVGAGKELYAVDAATGKARWEFAAQDFVTSSATVAGGRVFISDFKFIYGVDQASGALLWTYPAEGAISFSPVATERLVLVTRGDAVAALDAADGRQIWEYTVAGEKIIPGAVVGDLALLKSTESIYAVRLADGKQVWRFHHTNFISLPAVAGGQVFLVAGMGADTAVVALDAESGTSVWRQPIRSLANTAPVIAGGAVYVRLEDGRILGLWS